MLARKQKQYKLKSERFWGGEKDLKIFRTKWLNDSWLKALVLLISISPVLHLRLTGNQSLDSTVQLDPD